MDWLNQVLPTLATALGGPLAGLAAGFFADKMGLSDKTVESVKAAIAGAAPADLIRLKEIDLELQKFFVSADVDLTKIAAEDRNSARVMQSATHSWAPGVLTTFVVGSFVGVLALLFFRDVPIVNRDLVVYAVGQLSGGFASSLAFWMGTTKESSRKTELLAQSTPKE